jgi:two-component system CheB/CheR fusion protein
MLIGIIQTDLTGRIVLANRRFCEIVGRSLEQLTTLRMQDITHPDDLPKNIALFGRAASGGPGYEFEKRYLRPDGTAVWTRLQVRAIRDAHGAPKYLSGVCEDITPRKQAETQLEQLINREREAREQAERANRAKDSFLATLSHELRTPLTPVLMTAAARADDHSLDPEVREDFAGIRRNIELEARLIDDLLDLTRVARGKLPLMLGKVDIHALLAHTAEIVRGDAEQKGVWLTFDLEAHCFVEGDVARLQQVFWNLLKNAIKFTPPQGRITVHARTVEGDLGDLVEVVITDTGIGIPVEVMPRIFEAFEQGEVAGQHRFGGMGLGLAITKAIVEMHRGQIAVESPGRGAGATFRVCFNTTEPPTEVPVEEPIAEPTPPRPLRLLVVEDHAPTLSVLTKLLERRGHKVEPASTVRGALALAEVNRFDLVITDLGLPDGNGIELMQKLSTDYGLLGIALTGYGMEDDVARTKAAGFRAHLVKPISFELLDQTLEPFMRGAVE